MTDVRMIENERLSIKVEDDGAQLASIFDKKNNRELLWCADPAFWNRHAPILFPFVGELYNKQYIYKGKTYPMTSHGFARDSGFSFGGIQDGRIVHTLESTEETMKNYPFSFVLETAHGLDGKKVVVEWKVKNTGTEEMLFSIGAHPAFNVPAREGEAQKDYMLTFGQKTSLSYIRISEEHGTALYDNVKKLRLNGGTYPVGEHLFDDGVLIFEDGQVDETGIAFPDGQPYVTIRCKGFPYTGVWTKPGAPFICLEPWHGRCDDEGYTGELKDKKGIIRLEAGEEFRASYEIIVG